MHRPQIRKPSALLVSLALATLLGSCQESSSTPTSPQQASEDGYEAPIPALPGAWAIPDSLVWSIDGNTRPAELRIDGLDVVASARLASAPSDTVDIDLFASHLQLGRWHFRYRGTTALAFLDMEIEPLTVELLRRAGRNASPESLRVVLVKAMLERDSFLIAHPYAKNIPMGLDTAAVLRRFAIQVAAAGLPFTQFATSPTLPTDSASLRKLIRSLAASGDIKDTMSLFAPPKKPHDTIAIPVDTTKRHDTIAIPVDTTKRHDTTATPVDTTKRHDTTATPVDTTKRHDTTATPVDTTKRHDTTAIPVDTTKSVVKDTVAPAIERLAFPLRVPYDSSSLTVGWFATDDRGLTMVRINQDALPLGQKVFKRTIPLRVGENSVVFVAIDSAGNVSRDSIVVARAAGDTAAPTLRRLQPARDTAFGSGTTDLVVSWIVRDDRKLDTVAINGVGIRLAGDTASLRIPLSFGRNPVAIVATDSAGRVSRDSLLVTRRDDNAPVLTRKGTQAGDIRVPYDVVSFQASWLATDDDSVAKVAINGRALSAAGSNYSLAVPLEPGSNRIVIVATDPSGNTACDSLVVVREAADTQAPTITHVDTLTRTRVVPWETTSATLTWKVEDDVAVGSVKLGGTLLMSASGGIYRVMASLVVGENKFVLTAVDGRNNVRRDTVIITRLEPDAPVSSMRSESAPTVRDPIGRVSGFARVAVRVPMRLRRSEADECAG